MFEEAERRSQELEALYRADEALHRSLQPQDVLQALLEGATDMLGANKASVLLWDASHQRLSVQAAHGFDPEPINQMALEPGEAISAQVAATGQVIIVDDLDDDPRISPRIRALNKANNVRSLISIPIELGGEVFGVYNLHSVRPHRFSNNDRRLLLALAQRAAVALANARLFEDERLSRERLEVAVAAGHMGTWEWDMCTGVITWSTQLEVIHGLAPGTFGGTFDAYLAHIHPDDREQVMKTVCEAVERGELHLEYRAVRPDGDVSWFEAGGRLIRDAQGRAKGMRGVCRDVTSRKQAEVERARLLEREHTASKARAALEERQRLARELHDSVTQALYGIALGTQTVLAALDEDGDVPAASDAARYVLSLAEASIAEMRSLIFELRPESLEQDGLVAALERQVVSVRARHALRVVANLGSEPDIALEAKEALYRIAQEGMHNVVKHAHCTSLAVSLRQADRHVWLEIVDDGIGFDPTLAYPGHLGLTSMRERATELGAELSLASAPDHGTRLTVHLPA
jgi:PAS domain S-box-containing protein